MSSLTMWLCRSCQRLMVSRQVGRFPKVTWPNGGVIRLSHSRSGGAFSLGRVVCFECDMFQRRLSSLSADEGPRKPKRVGFAQPKTAPTKEERKQYAWYQQQRSNNAAYYLVSFFVFMFGMCWVSVPLYRKFCQKTGLGGTTQVAELRELEKIAKMEKVTNRLIKVRFQSDIHSSMRWKFRPQQSEIWVHPGETALAFYTAMNPTNVPVVGISTYNIVPYDAAIYFFKIQCFCFEEQMLNPGETVDMPVFFYLDPELVDDPKMEYVDEVVLNYTFFESKQGLKLPSPFDKPRES